MEGPIDKTYSPSAIPCRFRRVVVVLTGNRRQYFKNSPQDSESRMPNETKYTKRMGWSCCPLTRYAVDMKTLIWGLRCCHWDHLKPESFSRRVCRPFRLNRLLQRCHT
ncbi:Serine/threonine protein phosphatase 2A 55 kDa regulatory subunit B' delta isoform [Zea mays]|uniref:Serine/threonine protein phosphatase 2A 55 kDa regulatory subunit B' delta isoform n=1 Tax=Zea mays TaxID=4577 RepID=A0A1D6PV50_MAIZE|nr:Serine/threonine protein phosphatase 2A 55 kDa regulatory subunit B' delta isoform [Zea mays]AQK50458.1 Serine/threonine protein phosphatase 2A 55 kDa regulatory subunit B' delta isoform [Zea mays]